MSFFVVLHPLIDVLVSPAEQPCTVRKLDLRKIAALFLREVPCSFRSASFDAVFQAQDTRIVRTPVQMPEANGIIDVSDLRTKLDMTQRVFGAQFGVSRQQVQKWEQGRATPHRRQIERLVKLAAAAMEVTVPLRAADPEMLDFSGRVCRT
jgi:DNA-binding transcriptional regulator YiaG